MIYKTSLPYTVPSPQGKAAGVGYDGRLHLLCAHQVGTPAAAMPGGILTYTVNGITGSFRTGNQAASVPTEGGTSYHQLVSEPAVAMFSGEIIGEPLQEIFSGAGTGFRWLPAGTVVNFIRDTELGAGSMVIDLVLVEDFGQLAEGDEYQTQQRPGDFGGQLLTGGS